MATCTLCGNEEVERPIACNRQTPDGRWISFPFGRYCYTRKRQACYAKIRELMAGM